MVNVVNDKCVSSLLLQNSDFTWGNNVALTGLNQMWQPCSPISLQHRSGDMTQFWPKKYEEEAARWGFWKDSAFLIKRDRLNCLPQSFCVPMPLSPASIVSWDLRMATLPPAIMRTQHQMWKMKKKKSSGLWWHHWAAEPVSHPPTSRLLAMRGVKTAICRSRWCWTFYYLQMSAFLIDK